MELAIDPVTGNISDVTQGITSGTPNKRNGNNLFYMIGYSFFVTTNPSGNVYKPFQDVHLPEGIHTIRRYDMKADKIQTQQQFEERLNGYPADWGVNMHNGRLNEITITIRDL